MEPTMTNEELELLKLMRPELAGEFSEKIDEKDLEEVDFDDDDTE